MARKRTPELEAFGAALRELRTSRGWSQDFASARAGTHRNYWGGVERSELNPTFVVLWRIAAAFEMPLSELIALAERHLEG